MNTNRCNINLQQIWQGDPLLPYYNLQGLTDIILTCDVDWAPDFAIECVLDLVQKYGCKITVFATHKSNVLVNAPSFVEVGLHPDFTRPHSNTWFDEKLYSLKEIYPSAKGMRSHRNFFGQNIADIAKKCGLIYDASVFLWNEPFCQAHQDYNGMFRFSYMWEDGIHLDMGLPHDWNNINLHNPGLKIINVHPILIYLNCISEEQRRIVTSKYKDLTKASRTEIDIYVNKEKGIKDLWESLLQMIKIQGINTYQLKDLVNF
ncbi:hypothetical protein JCM14036_06690 [Desulfotomaculum defluvii]